MVNSVNASRIPRQFDWNTHGIGILGTGYFHTAWAAIEHERLYFACSTIKRSVFACQGIL